MLRDTFYLVSEAQMINRVLTREMTIYTPHIVDADGNVEGPKGPLYWFTQTPDRELHWQTWLGRLMRNMYIYDAPALYHDLNDQALVVMDGSTLFCCVDVQGRTPRGENPAYCQVIKGMPFGWWTADQVEYMPQNIRENAPYGTPPVEQAWSDVMLLANIKAFSLAHYREGNLPESIFTPDAELSPDQITEWEKRYDELMSGAQARSRMKLMPFGGKWTETKSPDWPAVAYGQAFNNLAFTSGLPVSELAKVPGHGLGGSGFEDAMAQALFRMGLGPIADHVEAMCNSFLQKLDLGGRTFKLSLPAADADPTAAQAAALSAFENAGITLNEFRIASGHPPVEGGNVYMVIRGGQVTWVGNVSTLEGQSGADGAIDQNPETTVSDDSVSKNLLTTGKEHPERTTFVLGSGYRQEDLAKLANATLRKVTGCTPDDDEYYGAPIVAPIDFEWPTGGHANEVFVVAIVPEPDAEGHQLPSWPGVWKPLSGENPKLISRIGGFQFLREEAAYLLDRALGFYLVPVAYCTQLNGDPGAVLYYVRDSKPPRGTDQYSLYWLQRAAILDYISGQGDRHVNNWGTHPYDPQRPIMWDNGLTFPTTNQGVFSPFVEAMENQALPPGLIANLKHLQHDIQLWGSIEHLVGPTACELAQARLNTLIEAGGILITEDPETSVLPTGETTMNEDPIGFGD